ncbi:MAG TPA: hypothetical protein VFG76_04735 [Candidatus Polarisedimenticolia bacterium]|nr:hypothetical protein [Candidatus Polarisedimenticolia bacterium]
MPSSKFAICLIAAAAVAAMGAARPTEESSLMGWKSLTLEAQKAALFSASTRLSVSEATQPGTGKPVHVLTTRSLARLLGATAFEEQTTSYIDSAKGRPVEFFQLRPGDSARRYLFLDGLVRQTTWEPLASKRDEDFKRWPEIETVDRRLTYADGTGPAGGEMLTDLYSMIYLLRDSDLSAAEPAPREFTALYRRHVVKIRITAGERRTQERTVTRESTGKQETLRLHERRLQIQPLGAGSDQFRGLMGMQGDTAIWVDEKSGAVVEISGSAPGIGATQATLVSFER